MVSMQSLAFCGSSSRLLQCYSSVKGGLMRVRSWPRRQKDLEKSLADSHYIARIDFRRLVRRIFPFVFFAMATDINDAIVGPECEAAGERDCAERR